MLSILRRMWMSVLSLANVLRARKAAKYFLGIWSLRLTTVLLLQSSWNMPPNLSLMHLTQSPP